MPACFPAVRVRHDRLTLFVSTSRSRSSSQARCQLGAGPVRQPRAFAFAPFSRFWMTIAAGARATGRAAALTTAVSHANKTLCPPIRSIELGRPGFRPPCTHPVPLSAVGKPPPPDATPMGSSSHLRVDPARARTPTYVHIVIRRFKQAQPDTGQKAAPGGFLNP